MEETLQQRIKRLKLCRDCIDRTYQAGLEAYERLDKEIEKLEKQERIMKLQLKKLKGVKR